MDQPPQTTDHPDHESTPPAGTRPQSVQIALEPSTEERLLSNLTNLADRALSHIASTELKKLQLTQESAERRQNSHQGFVLKLVWPAMAVVGLTIAGCLLLRSPERAVEVIQIVVTLLGGAGLTKLLSWKKADGPD